MRLNILIFLFVLVSQGLLAGTYLEENVHEEKTDGYDVVWIQDDKFPTFTLSIYFKDGAIHDGFEKAGLTKATFDLMTSGAEGLSQKDISDFFDFYGASLSSVVTHEYSLFQTAGLLKDAGKILGKVCELYRGANYPENEIISFKSRVVSGFKNLPTNHAALAERAFRMSLLKGTPFEAPTEGSTKSISNLKRESLIQRLHDLKKASKKIYITGPREAKNIVSFLDTCGFSQGNKNEVSPSWKKNEAQIVFVPVEGANQAQIRIGQLFSPSEIENDNRDTLTADFLGGGFTSKLVQELRVKRGLTYGASAHLSAQRDYVRAGIATFTKNETLGETLKVIKDIIETNSDPKMIQVSDVDHIKKYAVGSHPFTFENILSFVSQLILLDHRGKPYAELDHYVKDVNSVTPSTLAKNLNKYYQWDKMIIVVVGNPSLETELKKWGKVTKIKVAELL